MKATIVIPNINGKGWLKDSIESVYALSLIHISEPTRP